MEGNCCAMISLFILERNLKAYGNGLRSFVQIIIFIQEWRIFFLRHGFKLGIIYFVYDFLSIFLKEFYNRAFEIEYVFFKMVVVFPNIAPSIEIASTFSMGFSHWAFISLAIILFFPITHFLETPNNLQISSSKTLGFKEYSTFSCFSGI